MGWAPVGERLRTERQLRGWSIEELAYRTGLSARHLTRIERGQSAPQPESLMALAGALDMDVAKLLTGHAREALVELAEENSCSTCGAKLVERRFVDHEYGDNEFEIFECGSTQGWQWRPCPESDEFPNFDDYELTILEDEGRYVCLPRGRTRAAAAVDLGHGSAATKAEAERQVRWTYFSLRHGREAADRELGPRWPGLDG